MQPDGEIEPIIAGRGRPYFFLSYARTPKRDPGDKSDPDRWVYKLYKDLCDEILQMTDARPGEAAQTDFTSATELGAEPAQLVAQRGHPHGVEQRGERAEVGTEPPRRTSSGAGR